MHFLVTDRINIKFVELTTGLAQMMIIQQIMGITLWNVESNGELQQILFLLPSISIIHCTVKLLTEMKSIVNSTPNERLIIKNNK